MYLTVVGNHNWKLACLTSKKLSICNTNTLRVIHPHSNDIAERCCFAIVVVVSRSLMRNVSTQFNLSNYVTSPTHRTSFTKYLYYIQIIHFSYYISYLKHSKIDNALKLAMTSQICSSIITEISLQFCSN